MKLRRFASVLLPLVVLLWSCSSPDVVKKRYLDAGNRYFDGGKYSEAQLMYKNALKKDARFGEAYYRLGLCDMKMGRPTEAVAALRRAIELQPQNDDAAAKLVDLYMTYYFYSKVSGKDRLRDEIDDLVRTIRKRDPNSFDAQRVEGYLAFRDGDVQKAAKLLTNAHRLKPDDYRVSLSLTQALFALHRNDEAQKLALSIIEKQKTFTPAYDVLASYYLREKRMGDAEKTLKLKVANNPKDVVPRLELARFYFATVKKAEMENVLDEILRDRGNFPNGLLVVGDFFARLKQFDTAINYYREGAGSGGQFANICQTRVVETLVAQSKVTEATSMLDQMLKDNPNNQDAVQMRAALRLQGGRPEEVRKAISELTPLLSKQPKNPVLRFNIGRAYLTLHELDAAAVQLREAVNLKPDFVPPRLAMAQIYLFKRQFGDALTESGEVLKYDPQNSVAKLIRTAGLMGSGMLDEARSEVENTLKGNPNSAEALFQLGLLNLAQKKLDQSEAAFTKMRNIVPGDSRPVFGLAEVSFARGDSAGALRLLQDQVDKFPERTDFRLALANSLLRASRFQEAIGQYKYLLSKDPQSASLHLRIGETYRRSGDLKASVEHFEKARSLAPKDPQASLYLAISYDTGGRRNDAKPLYEEVLNEQPDNVVALNNLAFILAEEGQDLDRALTLAQRAKQRAPNNDDVADTLGWIYIKKNLPNSAVSIFQDLVKKQPDRSTFLYHLGLALKQKGDLSDARKNFDTALKKNPSKDEEQQIKQIISSMS